MSLINGLVKVAQTVVKAVSKILPFPISLSDEEGYIIGASDSSRVGTLHEPSKEVLLKGDFMSFDEEQANQLDNVLAGVAVPLNFGHTTIGVLGIIGSPQTVKPYAQLIKNYVEMMWQEAFHKQVEDLETKTLEAFLQYLLLSEKVNKTRLEQYCQVLRLDYIKKYFCIVIDVGDSLMNSYENERRPFTVNNYKKKLLNCTYQAFNVDVNDICAFLNLEKIIVLKKVDCDENYVEMIKKFPEQGELIIQMLKSYHTTDIFIAAGSLSESLQHANQSYREAEYLLAYSRESVTPLQVSSYYDWNVLLKLLPEHMNNHLQDKIYFRLNSLIQDEHFNDLKRDFLMYCEQNMNISKAAEKLFIHRNTLIYRLQKIERLTTLDTRNFQHCTLLYLSLKNLKAKNK